MKILHVSDLHSIAAWFDWLIAESPNYELVCLTGDILNLGDLSSDIDREIDATLNAHVAGQFLASAGASRPLPGMWNLSGL